MSTSDLEWRTSRRSGGHSHCVQIALVAGEVGGDRLLLMRDSKDTAGSTLAITPAEWTMFTRQIKGGRLSF
ncbi:MAG: DUF397 domain-containing protein [Streptosporangiaceae bacterium]